MFVPKTLETKNIIEKKVAVYDQCVCHCLV
jgi:hypothetical protein